MIQEPFTKLEEAFKDTVEFFVNKRFASNYVKKTANFIVLPAFNIPNTWYGASHIIAKYKYTISNKFSILKLPARPNDTFCLALTFGATPNRYKLWQNIGEILYVPLYSSEIIDSSFNLEVWNTFNNANAINSSSLIIDISILSIPDICNFNCDEFLGLDKALSRTLTCDNTFLLTGWNPSLQQFSFVNNPCAGELINL